MQTFSRGNLTALWRVGDEPTLPDTAVRQIYDTVFKPHLERDIMRLHEVMVGSIKRVRALCFDDYLKALMDFKKTLASIPLPDVEAVDAKFAKLHDQYIAQKVFVVRRASKLIAADQEFEAPTLNTEGYMQACFNSIGYDTSEAIDALSERLCSDKGRAALYNATLQGPDAVKKMLTEQWVYDRSEDDIANLRKKLLDCVSTQKLKERVTEIQRTRKDAQANDEQETEIRRLNIRLVA